MNALVEQKKPGGAVAMGSGGGAVSLKPQNLGEVVAFANIMATADLALPKHLRANPGACMAVAMQAFRWEMDPFAVANKTYFVNDRIAYEAQLVASVIHTRAPIRGRPRYEFIGEDAARQCKITCVMADGEEREYLSPRFDKILTKNSPLWKSDPDQQLGYFSIRSWARRHTPEVILGVYTADEVETFEPIEREVKPKSSGLAERLAGSQRGAGFSREHVDQTTGEVIEAEVVDVTEGEAQEAEDAAEEPTTAGEPENAASDPDFSPDVDPDPINPAEFLKEAERYIDMAEKSDILSGLYFQWKAEGALAALKKDDQRAFDGLIKLLNSKMAELEKKEGVSR